MPYAERTNPANRTPNHRKATSLPMPIAAYHNDEQKHISTANSFLRRKCLEYFADTATGEIGLRCTFCRDLSEEDRAELRSFVFPRQIVGIHAAVVTLQYSHLPYCTEVPEEVLEHLDVLKENDLIVAERNKDKGGSNNSSGGGGGNKQQQQQQGSSGNNANKRYRWGSVAHEMGLKDTNDGIRFIPPEIPYGRKRQATMRDNPTSSGLYSSNSSSAASDNELLADFLPTRSSADWKDGDDLRLWNAQNELGNKWKDITEQVFKTEFRSDQVRNRWYSQPFKDYIARSIGKNSYKQAQQMGKQMNYAGGAGAGAGSQSSSGPEWNVDDDVRLWKNQNECGNKWKEIGSKMGFASDTVRNRWYSQPFKDYIAANFGKAAYKSAQQAGKQMNYAGQSDWSEEDDLRLWNGQNELGNKWKEITEQNFSGTFESDQVRNRWYSQQFKDYVARNFGKAAYKAAQQMGKQMTYAGMKRKSEQPSRWTPEEDMRLWKTQEELGNSWKEVADKMGYSNKDHVKSRWYSDKFRDFVANTFGKDAYKAAHVAGKVERTGARPQVDWTEDDDRTLWLSRQEMGNKWEDISKDVFKKRLTENHCKNRWYSAAFKKFVAENFGVTAYQDAKIGRRGAQCQVDWSAGDDMLLWKSHVELGNKWDIISNDRFKKRINENQVKNRWYSQPFKKFVASEFGPDVHKNAKHKRD